jgi:DNA-binding IclR family transcriptional regulator
MSKSAARNKIASLDDVVEDAKQPLYAAPALEKGLDILELLSAEDRGLSRKDIADRLGRSVGEIFRMIECLTRRSYLVQTEDSFQLSMKLFELSHAFPPLNRLVSEALPRMRALAQATQQSCHMTVLSGAEQLVIAQIDAPEGMGFSIKVGAKLPVLKSASGRVLTAFQGNREIEEILALVGPDMTEQERGVFTKTLQKVRKDGYAFMKSNQFAGLQAMSYPIVDLGGHAMAALTVPYVARLDDETRPTTDAAKASLEQVVAELNKIMGGYSDRSAKMNR